MAFAAAVASFGALAFSSILTLHLAAASLTHACSSSSAMVIRLLGSTTSNRVMMSLASAEICFHSFSKNSYLAPAT